MFVPCGNAVGEWGDNRDCVVPRPSTDTPEGLAMFRTLGRLMGAALRTGVRLPLAFPSLVWKQLVGQELGMGDLEAVDQFLVRSVVKVSVVEGCVLSNLGGGI